MASYGHGDLSGGFSTSYSSTASGNDFSRLQQSVSSNIQKISQNVKRCQQMVDQIGTPTDSGNLTSDIQKLQHSNNELAKTTSTQLRNLKEALSNSSPAEKRQRDVIMSRLTDDFGSVLNRVQKIQREAADKERESLRRARTHSASNSNPFADPDDYTSSGYSAGLVSFDDSPKQKSMQAVLEEEDNLRAIQEREAAVKSLESDILDVNQIFKDLGSMVHEQGEMIDSIESNVERAAVHVEEGNTQLVKAVKNQKSARRKKIILVVILLIILLIVGLAVGIPLANKAAAAKNNNKN